MPTAGKMILDQAKLADTMTAEDIDAMYQKALKDDLY
jgi:hypothetical protein